MDGCFNRPPVPCSFTLCAILPCGSSYQFVSARCQAHLGAPLHLTFLVRGASTPSASLFHSVCDRRGDPSSSLLINLVREHSRTGPLFSSSPRPFHAHSCPSYILHLVGLLQRPPPSFATLPLNEKPAGKQHSGGSCGSKPTHGQSLLLCSSPTWARTTCSGNTNIQRPVSGAFGPDGTYAWLSIYSLTTMARSTGY